MAWLIGVPTFREIIGVGVDVGVVASVGIAVGVGLW